MSGEEQKSIEDVLAEEAEELDGYFSETPLEPEPEYPPLKESFDNAIVITGLPVTPAGKSEKLTNVVRKVASRIGPLASYGEDGFQGIDMPLNPETGKTMGFAFVEFVNTDDARRALEALDNYKLDRNHYFAPHPFSIALKLKNMGEGEFKEPTPPPFVEKPNTMSWMEDPSQRDQFVIRHGQETCVSWFDARNDPVVDYDGAREKEAGTSWCTYYCYWSPKGSFLATIVPARGVILWGGKNYEKIDRFAAPNVKTIVFSPQENYMITNTLREDDEAAIKIHHITTGKLLKAFSLYPATMKFDDDERKPPPPPFLWSHDDKYLARMSTDSIMIHETPSMKLLDSMSFIVDDIREFLWSPKANILACWAPESGNTPAHVDIVEIPSRKKLRQRNLVNVSGCNMVFHPDGTFLAVKVTRHTKSKKTLYNNIELFRLLDDGIPVEMLDMKDAVMSLVWEPRGTRFAMIHAENPSSTKVQVSFYDMMKKQEITTVGKSGKKKGQQQKTVTKVPELNLLETLEGRQCNMLFWSPAGQTIILASLGDSASGTLEFYDVDTKSLVVKEHYRANQVIWDPAGRSVATCVTQPIEGGHFKFAMDNGYIIWSFQGRQLYQQSFETFFQFIWRPRETLLSKSQIGKVRKNLKKYEAQFEKADKERARALYLEETKGKREERQRYRDIRAAARSLRKRQRARHIELLSGYDSEDDAHYTIREVTVETVLSSKEETV